jgi:hypothetical protein
VCSSDLSLVADSRETGVAVFTTDTAATMRDVTVLGVESSIRGFGLGVALFGGVRVELERLAVERVRGAAVAVMSLDLPPVHESAVALIATDVFLRSVASSTVQFDGAEFSLQPAGASVAYGVHVGEAGTFGATRVVIDGGGYGFFVADGGALRVRSGVITRQLDAAGALTVGGSTRAVLDAVALVGNAVDAVVPNVELPSIATLPLPTPVCDMPSCR